MTPNTPTPAADFYWPVVLVIVALMSVVMIWHELSATREYLDRLRKRDEQRRFGLEKELERGALVEAARTAMRTEMSRLMEASATPGVTVRANEPPPEASPPTEAKVVETDLGRRRFLPLHK
jgi:hypothetical protein